MQGLCNLLDRHACPGDQLPAEFGPGLVEDRRNHSPFIGQATPQCPGTRSDGSVDVYFGPREPQSKENNWVQTIPGQRWNTLLRLASPLEPWFDKTWRPGRWRCCREANAPRTSVRRNALDGHLKKKALMSQGLARILVEKRSVKPFYPCGSPEGSTPFPPAFPPH